jgi:hypothetical protein
MRVGSGAGPITRFGLSWPVAVSLRKPPLLGLEKLGFPWILSSESSLINGLRGNFAEIIFVVLCHLRGRLAVDRLEIVGETVDLVDEPLPLLLPVTVFRHNRLLMLVEPP